MKSAGAMSGGKVLAGAGALAAIVLGVAYVSGVGGFGSGRILPPDPATSVPQPPAPAPGATAALSAPETSPPSVETPEQAVPEAGTDAADTTAAPVETEAGTDAAEPAAPTETTEAAAPAQSEADLPDAPRFDLVRAEADGLTLVAGVALPDALVAVLLDGREHSRANTDATGRFVSFLDLGISPVPRVLRLRLMTDAGSVDSEEEIILAPTPVAQTAEVSPAPSTETTGVQPETSEATGETSELPQGEGAQVTTAQAETIDSADTATPSGAQDNAAQEPAAETVPETSQTAQAAADTANTAGSADAPTANEPVKEQTTTPGAESPQVVAQAPQAAAAPVEATDTTRLPEATAPVADAAQQPAQAPTVLVSRAEGVEVLTPPEATTNLELDTITYDAAGAVQLTGRSPWAGFVRVYLDNRPVVTAPVAESGRWRADLPQVDTGVYTLRVDQIDAEGTVVSRVESPFKREDPALLVASDAGSDAPVRAVTVQPGNTLWAIARDRYGEGVAYVKVFEANRNRIRNPDLIYPGQVFDLPD